MSETATPERKIIPIGNRGLQLGSTDELLRFSNFVIESGFSPKDFGTPQKVFIALAMGMEAGLSPMASLQNVCVVNGRPSFYGDICQAIVMASGLLEDEKEEWTGTEGQDDFTCTVKLKRVGIPTPRTGKWSVKDSRIAGLGNVHKSYPRIMMYWRAWHVAAKIFSDVLKGVRPAEIVQEESRIGFDGAKTADARVMPPILPTKESLENKRSIPENGETKTSVAPPIPADKKSVDAPTGEAQAPNDKPAQDTARGADETSSAQDPRVQAANAEPANHLEDDPEEIGYWFWIRKHLVELEMTETQFMFFLRQQGIASTKSKNLDQVPEDIVKGIVKRWDNIRRKIAEEAQEAMP